MASFLRKFNRQLLQTKKQSPHIFFVVGIVGTVTSTVLACRATLKLSDTLDDIQHEIDGVKELRHSESQLQAVELVEDWRKDTVYIYGKAGIRIIRLYGPSVVIAVVSIGALTGSHVQLTRRNAALMTAYAAIQKAYDEYRVQVQNEFGKAKELEIYHHSNTNELVTNENNRLEKVIINANSYSPYAKFFDEFSPHWQRDSELNRLFVQCQQNYANDLLQSRGHIFLNEVYDMLGIERSQAGAVVGWVIGDEGDNFVDFGIFDAFNSSFVNGVEQSILLDFNVDGVVYNKI